MPRTPVTLFVDYRDVKLGSVLVELIRGLAGIDEIKQAKLRDVEVVLLVPYRELEYGDQKRLFSALRAAEGLLRHPKVGALFWQRADQDLWPSYRAYLSSFTRGLERVNRVLPARFESLFHSHPKVFFSSQSDTLGLAPAMPGVTQYVPVAKDGQSFSVLRVEETVRAAVNRADSEDQRAQARILAAERARLKAEEASRLAEEKAHLEASVSALRDQLHKLEGQLAALDRVGSDRRAMPAVRVSRKVKRPALFSPVYDPRRKDEMKPADGVGGVKRNPSQAAFWLEREARRGSTLRSAARQTLKDVSKYGWRARR